MTENASCRNPICFLGSLRLEDWAQETSDRGGQDKANWRSRIRRPSAVEKCLSAHWFLKLPRLAVNDIRWGPAGGFQVLRRISTG